MTGCVNCSIHSEQRLALENGTFPVTYIRNIFNCSSFWALQILLGYNYLIQIPNVDLRSRPS